MYIGIDIGGTKTLVASLDEQGVIREQQRFLTPQSYGKFLQDLAKAVAVLTAKKFDAAVVGIPGKVDRAQGQGIVFGNLPWRDVPIRFDLERMLHCSVAVENDAKLAGLSEAMLIKHNYEKVLYITLGTGIGIAMVNKGRLNLELSDLGGKTLFLEHKGKMISWEDIASGRAILRRFGKRAGDIEDKVIWQYIAEDISVGLIELVALFEPDIIIMGGGVNAYFDKFSTALRAALKKYETPLLPIPPIERAQRPEEAVVYGCYDWLRSNHANVA
jgi:predicted NBD/HSP70 family sugar kinase